MTEDRGIVAYSNHLLAQVAVIGDVSKAGKDGKIKVVASVQEELEVKIVVGKFVPLLLFMRVRGQGEKTVAARGLPGNYLVTQRGSVTHVLHPHHGAVVPLLLQDRRHLWAETKFLGCVGRRVGVQYIAPNLAPDVELSDLTFE